MEHSITLDDFIAHTLEQICAGVLKARTELERVGANAGPIDPSTPNRLDALVRPVEFDVCVEASQGETTERKLDIKVLGGSTTTETAASTASRVRFSIPLSLPLSRTCLEVLDAAGVLPRT